MGREVHRRRLDPAGDPVRLGQLVRGARARPLLSPARRALRRRRDPASRCASSGRRSAIAAATTAVGFYSFVTTDVRPMRSFGIACGSGVLLCWLTSLTLVPAVVALFPRKAHQEVQLDAPRRRARRHVALGAAPPARSSSSAALALGALSIGPMLRVRVRMEPRAFFREGSEPWLAERFLDRALRRRHLRADLAHRRLRRSVDAARGRAPRRLRALLARRHAGAVGADAADAGDQRHGRHARDPVEAHRRRPTCTCFSRGSPASASSSRPSGTTRCLHIRMHGDAPAALAALERFAREDGCAASRARRPSRTSPSGWSWQARAWGRTVSREDLLADAAPARRARPRRRGVDAPPQRHRRRVPEGRRGARDVRAAARRHRAPRRRRAGWIARARRRARQGRAVAGGGQARLRVPHHAPRRRASPHRRRARDAALGARGRPAHRRARRHLHPRARRHARRRSVRAHRSRRSTPARR